MSVIEANITIDIPDGEDSATLIDFIRNIISRINDLDTYVSVTEVDDPLSLSPVNLSRIKEI